LRKIGRQTQASIGGVSAQLLEGLASIKVAKTYQLEDRWNERSREDLEELRALEVLAGDHQALIDPMMEVLGGLVIVGVLFFVGWRLEAGQNTLGDFAGFITALLLAGQPLRALGNLAGYVQLGLAATQRIFQVLDEPARVVSRRGAEPLEVARGEVTFEAATYSYEGDTRPALDNVSLTVPGGTRLALVGRSGAGKRPFST
jgi:subfamily B ATP-binding cassette protein MsbA